MDYWKVNIAELLANRNFASHPKHLRIHGLPLEEISSPRVDVAIKKILESMYDELVLEIQPGNIGKGY